MTLVASAIYSFLFSSQKNLFWSAYLVEAIFFNDEEGFDHKDAPRIYFFWLRMSQTQLGSTLFSSSCFEFSTSFNCARRSWDCLTLDFKCATWRPYQKLNFIGAFLWLALKKDCKMLSASLLNSFPLIISGCSLSANGARCFVANL